MQVDLLAQHTAPAQASMRRGEERAPMAVDVSEQAQRRPNLRLLRRGARSRRLLRLGILSRAYALSKRGAAR